MPGHEGEALRRFVAETVNRLAPGLIARRRDLHRHPEEGWCEFRTAALAIARLRELGYVVRMGPEAAAADRRMGVPGAGVLALARERAVAAGADAELVAGMGDGLTGFWADLDLGPGAGQGPLTAFRFDMDCNTIDECGEPDHRPCREGFASVHPGLMHACGHDGHVALGVGLAEAVAEALAPARDGGRAGWGAAGRLRGRIRLIFQPAEEGARGGLPLTEAGAVDGADCLVGLHIGFQAGPGEVICGTRDFFATTKRDVVFTGAPAHAAAAPEQGRNALLAACGATLGLHAISRHSGGRTRVSVGRLEGGEARNIIPAEARLYLETRGESAELEAYMGAEAERILRAGAAMWGCACSIAVAGGSCGAASSPVLAAVAAEEAEAMGGFSAVIPMRDFGATEDVAWMMRRVQERGGLATYLQLGTARAAGHHQPRFDFDEACLARGLELLFRLALRLNGPGLPRRGGDNVR